MAKIVLTIDGKEVKAEEGVTILKAAQDAGIYIPFICAHPDLPPAPKAKPAEAVYRGTEPIKGDSPEKEYIGCGLCAVKVEGMNGLVISCNVPAAAGMVVQTKDAQLEQYRKDRFSELIATHPHYCVTCDQRTGCSPFDPVCHRNVTMFERCCIKVGNCEIQKLADLISIKQDTPRYAFRNLPKLNNDPLFDRDYNLCIGCTRCIRACKEMRGIGVYGFVWKNGEVLVGTLSPTMKTSECKFCGACVEVCPTGALLDRDIKRANREKELVPCKHACPINIDVPQYVRFISNGKASEALAVVREKTPLPGVLGNVCFHPCETKCRRGKLNEPIAICALKGFAAEHDTGIWKQNLKVASATGKRVAIVGSGPSGLTAAFYLAKAGHTVTVFEAASKPGGMMQMGIPAYRLPRKILQRDIDEIVKLGVEIKTNTPIGNGLTINDLKNQGYHAVLIAAGAQLSRKLKIEGADSPEVLWGVDFLKAVNMGEKVRVKDRVLVVGGGNVAIDVALTALRVGAKEVKMACLESREEMPAHEWEIQEAIDEGIQINPSWGPKKVLAGGKGIAGMELVCCTSVFDSEKRFNPCFDESKLTTLEADQVILAIGQAPELSFLKQGSAVEVTPRGTIKVDDNMETTDKGVFAAGEAVINPGSVVDAVAAGRKAAAAIDKHLGGSGIIDAELAPIEKPNPCMGREEGFADRNRIKMPSLPVAERAKGFAQIELGFDDKLALAEARRCLQCDIRFNINAPMLPPENWLTFDATTIATIPEKDGVFQILDDKKNIIYIVGAQNMRQRLQEVLEQVSEEPSLQNAKYFLYEESFMFTMKESELIQHYMKDHGSMPICNSEILF